MRKPLLAVLAVVLTFPAVSFAQYNEESPAKIGIRGGVRQPAGSRVTDQASKWPEIGVDYVLHFEADKPQDVASLMYTATNKNLITAKLLGLEYMRQWSLSDVPDKGFFYGLGAGAYLSSVEIVETFLTPRVDESDMQFGLSMMAGYHLGRYWFVEVRYSKLPELAKDVDLSGLSVSIGIKRFLE